MKFKYPVSIALIATLLFISCDTSTNKNGQEVRPISTLDFNLLEEHLIDLPFDFNVGLNLSVQAYTRNDTDFIMMGDIEGSRLVEVDISHKRFSKAINLKRVATDRYPVFVHRYLNKDTILVFRNIGNEHSLYADTVLYSVNLKGNHNGSFTLVNSPYRIKGMNKGLPQASFYHQALPLEVSNNRLFVIPLPLFGTVKKTRAEEVGVHEIGFFDFKGTDSIVFQGVPYYRERDTSVVYAKEQETIYIHALSASEILVGPSNEPKLIRLNVNTGKYISSDETGRLIQDPKPLVQGKRKYAKNPESSIFKELIYDSDEQIIFRIGQLGTEVELKPGDLKAFRDSNVWVGAYDKDLKLIAQAMKPSWYSFHPKPFYFKGKFIGVSPTDNPRKFKLKYTSIRVSDFNQEDYELLLSNFNRIRPTVTRGDVNTLYRDYKIPENSIVLTVSNRSCPFCSNYSIEYFLLNLAQMEEDGVFLVVSDKSATPVLKSTVSRNIIIDKKNVLENLLNQSIDNPALMLWDGKKVRTTMVLPPDEVKLIDKYLELFKKDVTRQ